jgi:hypothetical protein
MSLGLSFYASRSSSKVCREVYNRLKMILKICTAFPCPARLAAAALAAALFVNIGFAKSAAARDRVSSSALLQIEVAHPAVSIGVMDETGAVIPRADVTFHNRKTGENTVGKTDGEGTLKLGSLAQGRYELTVASPGFRTQTIADIVVPSQKGVEGYSSS